MYSWIIIFTISYYSVNSKISGGFSVGKMHKTSQEIEEFFFALNFSN